MTGRLKGAAASWARAGGESFGADYELPNMSAYNETCAAVGNDFWNQRLFLLHRPPPPPLLHRRQLCPRRPLRRHQRL